MALPKAGSGRAMLFSSHCWKYLRLSRILQLIGLPVYGGLDLTCNFEKCIWFRTCLAANTWCSSWERSTWLGDRCPLLFRWSTFFWVFRPPVPKAKLQTYFFQIKWFSNQICLIWCKPSCGVWNIGNNILELIIGRVRTVTLSKSKTWYAACYALCLQRNIEGADPEVEAGTPLPNHASFQPSLPPSSAFGFLEECAN